MLPESEPLPPLPVVPLTGSVEEPPLPTLPLRLGAVPPSLVFAGAVLLDVAAVEGWPVVAEPSAVEPDSTGISVVSEVSRSESPRLADFLATVDSVGVNQ